MKIAPIFPISKFSTLTPKSHNVLIGVKRKQTENKVQIKLTKLYLKKQKERHINKIKTKTKYQIYILKNKMEKRKEKREITPELYQELINIHNASHGVLDTPPLQDLITPKISSIFDH